MLYLVWWWCDETILAVVPCPADLFWSGSPISQQEARIPAQGLRTHSGPDRATAYVPSEGYALADLTDPDRLDGLIVNIF